MTPYEQITDWLSSGKLVKDHEGNVVSYVFELEGVPYYVCEGKPHKKTLPIPQTLNNWTYVKN
jgi:hypothetical protein